MGEWTENFQTLQQGRHFISSFFTDLQILWIATRHSWSFLILKRRLGRRWDDTFLGEVQSRFLMSLQTLLPHSAKIRSRELISLKTFTSFMSDSWLSTDAFAQIKYFLRFLCTIKHSNTFSDWDSSPFQVVGKLWLLLWLQILMFLNQVFLQKLRFLLLFHQWPDAGSSNLAEVHTTWIDYQRLHCLTS